MKRILAALLAVAVLMSLFTSVVIADSSITITADGVYSDDTLAGTKLHVTSECTLGSGETIAYYLNGEKVGEATEAGKFTFTSVSGENKLTAKVLNGNNVVAVSNEITYNFKTIVHETTFASDDYTTFDSSKYIAFGTADKKEVVTDSEKGSVLKVELTPSQVSSWNAQFPKIQIRNKCKDGYLSLEYEAKFNSITKNDGTKVNFPRAIRLFTLKGNSGVGEINSFNIDWPGGGLTAYTRNVRVTPDAWHKIRAIFDMDGRTYDVYIDDEQVVSDQAIPQALVDPDYIILPRPMTNTTYTTQNSVFYLDNLKLERYIVPEISVSTPISNIVAGKKAALNVEVSGYDNGRFIYNVNGVDSEPTADTTYNANIIEGENTVFVKLVDESNNLILTSDKLNITGIPYQLETAKKLTFTNTDDTNNYFYPIVTNNPDAEDDEIIAGVLNLLDTADSAQGKVLQLKVSNTGNDYHQKAEISNQQKNVLVSKTGSDVISLDWKVKLVSMGKLESERVGKVLYKNAAGTEKGFIPFRFTTDGKLRIATSLNPSVDDASHRMEISAPAGNWYNFSVIADGKNEMIYLSVNDVVYSSFGFEDVTDSSYKLDVSNTLSNFYIQYEMGFGGVGTATNEVYIDDFAWMYAKAPSILTTPVFTNNGLEIDEKADINYTSSLNIDFNAINEGTDVKCIASVLSTAGGSSELIAVDAVDVAFTSSDYMKPVKLSLTNLPSDITSGNYTIRIMIWNGTNLAPVCDVIPFN